ncbi:MAG: DUF3109 family protein [Paludibacteraceae bacterium]|nr:DUF3109 family protein [Paludibacteraceae bacterium]
MIQIQNTIVSLEILEKEFCCDLDTCKGCCCIEGDAGAPLTHEEDAKLHELLPLLLPDMTPEARLAVEQGGVSYLDKDGELVTQIVNGRDCVFSRTDHNGWCYCLIERLHNAGKTDWKKPISCHLYPIRVKDFPARGQAEAFSALEYHRWDVCHCARKLGHKLHLPIYQFLKEPLIRRFGQEWYDELCLTAAEWRKQCNQPQ